MKPPPAGSDHHLVDKDLNIRVPVKAGPHVVAATFPKKPFLLLETERQPYQAHFNMDRHPRIQPAVYAISVTARTTRRGRATRPAAGGCSSAGRRRPSEEDGCAKRILATVMRRAYRRPVDRRRPRAAAASSTSRRAPTGGFEDGIEMALRSVLVSPEFLFRVEQDPAGVAPNTAYRVSDLELASRLSFFLWSSIPDDELLDAAAAGKLKTPAVLERQTRRMLADPRSRALVNNFADQWLYLRNLASAHPGHARSSRISTTTCGRRSARRPSCSSRASCARTAACSTCCAPTTRS